MPSVRLIVRFYTLSGKFEVAKTETFESTDKALKAVEAHVTPHGFTNVKIVDDGDYDGFRFTARTPGGRGGRNVAAADYDADFEEA